MDTTKNTVKLCLYASTTDKINGRLFYEYIILKARKEGLSGATARRGIMGYGASSKIHTSKFWELTEKLPVVITIIDEEMKIEAFYKSIESDLLVMPKGCLVTKEIVEVKLHKTGKKNERFTD
jgi:uncharacterized protein